MLVSFSADAPEGYSQAPSGPARAASSAISVAPREDWLKISDLKELRTQIRAHVAKAHAEAWSPHSLPPALIDFCRGKCIGLYSTVTRFHEPLVMPTEILALALTGEVQLAYPRVHGNDLHFCQVADPQRDLVPSGDFGIAEPSTEAVPCVPQILVMPALAVDRQGNRIGRGRGYYDRYLSQNSDITTLALVHSDYVFEAFDPSWIQAHDRKVDALLTESNFVPVSVSLRRFQ